MLDNRSVAAIGFLHTAAAHVATFRALLDDVAPDVDGAHIVDAELLTQAQNHGVDDALRERLRGRVAELAAQQVDIVLCSCSTLGGDAEALAARVHVPVLRVDRPMAEAAVAIGGGVAVVAAVASTLTPTRRLLEESAAAAGTATAVVLAPCLDAWALFEAGDEEGYARRVAEHVQAVARSGEADVIVLAQASMAPACSLLRDVAVPVLSSPRLAVERAAALARR